MKIYVVRHGETDWNKLNIFQGTSDIPLNAKGREQAKGAAEMLSNIKFASVYCSPLSRAKETCEIIMNNNRHGGEIIYDKRLIERSFGLYEGQNVETAIKAAKGRTWWLMHNEMPLPNGESIADIEFRVGSFMVGKLKLDNLWGQADPKRGVYFKYNPKSKYKKGDNILLVCHGGVARTIYFMFNQKPADGDLFKAFQVDNASIAEYDVEIFRSNV